MHGPFEANVETEPSPWVSALTHPCASTLQLALKAPSLEFYNISAVFALLGNPDIAGSIIKFDMLAQRDIWDFDADFIHFEFEHAIILIVNKVHSHIAPCDNRSINYLPKMMSFRFRLAELQFGESRCRLYVRLSLFTMMPGVFFS